jgi:hypothetical protein
MTAQNINPAAGAIQAPDITSQESLDQALAQGNVEQAKESVQPSSPEAGESGDQPKGDEGKEAAKAPTAPEKIFGIFDDMSTAEKSYKELYTHKTKIETELKELKKAAKDKEFSELKNMDYDDQVAFLTAKLRELTDVKEEAPEKVEAQPVPPEKVESTTADQDVLDFIKTQPLLQESGFADEFYLIATHPKYKEVKLEEIYSKVIEPKLKKWGGTKLTTKERPLRSATQPSGSRNKTVAEMSPVEYEANRESLLQEAGVRF